MQVNIHHVYLVPPGGERGGLALKALSVGEFKKKLLTFRGGLAGERCCIEGYHLKCVLAMF